MFCNLTISLSNIVPLGDVIISTVVCISLNNIHVFNIIRLRFEQRLLSVYLSVRLQLLICNYSIF